MRAAGGRVSRGSGGEPVRGANRAAGTSGGRNGYGAKLCNIFSTKFTVETACKEYRHSFKQVSRQPSVSTATPTNAFQRQFLGSWNLWEGSGTSNPTLELT